MLKEGKLAPELFDKSFAETPKSFLLQSRKRLDGVSDGYRRSEQNLRREIRNAAPSFRRLTDALKEVRHVVHGFLQKKRETEPDPVEEAPPCRRRADAAGAATEFRRQPRAWQRRGFRRLDYRAWRPRSPTDKRERSPVSSAPRPIAQTGALQPRART